MLNWKGNIGVIEIRLVTSVLHALTLAPLAWQAPVRLTERVIPNDNRILAGVLAKGVLTLRLEARLGRWFPDGNDGPSLVMPMFAESGRAPRNPGPLIRVTAGTTIRVSVRNALADSTLVVYGLMSRPGALTDTIQVRPGATRELSFSAGAPGTYFYWGTTTRKAVADRGGIDSQLHGAFIIDPPGKAPPPDRVFVLADWIGPRDSASGYSPELRVINGLSWPHTERLTYTVGDTIRWRWVNPSESPHPMHLHGFYFDITSRGTWAADTALEKEDQARVVTEMPLSGGTFAMTWVPDEPGNWLFHCHVAFHTSLYLSPRIVPDPKDPVLVHPGHGMKGMVLAVTIRPGRSTARRPATVSGAREIRLIAQAAPKRFAGIIDEMAFVRQEGNTPPAADSVPIPSSPLVLERGKPVRITIVNRMRAPTGVHWHGIEVPSYSDGVPDWSGIGRRTAPTIEPGDSFVAEFTPPRSGTFIYHAHANETFQVNLGLYGALLVVDSGSYDPAHERLVILGGHISGSNKPRINGKHVPDPLQMKVGETYRLRLIHIIPDWTARIRLMQGDSVLSWRALAKDGAELPAHRQTVRRSELIAGPGETFDFEYRPSAPGLIRLEVMQRTGVWKMAPLPIRVEP
ncbi:MAG TPA: multicopper oxidase domain-containing protein [Gemmatimonadales bacterium]|nr:multicopper oxidase domain-containing protein [Gemmatimonadales bacterium]